MKNGLVTVLIMVAIGLFVWGIFLWRATISARSQAALCGVIYDIVVQGDRSVGKKGTSTYGFFHGHPGRIKLAHRENQKTLDQLPCSPKRNAHR